jgi:hypothetical protein
VVFCSLLLVLGLLFMLSLGFSQCLHPTVRDDVAVALAAAFEVTISIR